MHVDAAGFNTTHELADKFAFYSKGRVWKPLETDVTGQTVYVDASSGVIPKIRASLLDLGFEMYVKGKLRLGIRSTLAPFLTWDGGSVGPGVPTPQTNWVAVSFRDNQPPVVFGFVGAPSSLIVEGKSGDWTLATEAPYEGWVRVSAPTGTRSFRTTSAAELGALVAEIRPMANELRCSPHKLVKTEVSGDTDGLTAKFTFDRPRAMIPSYWPLAQLGGYDLKILSGISYSKFLGDDGPAVFADTDSVRIRFPARRIPLGRSIVLGFRAQELPATVSALDWNGVIDLALPNLFASSDEQLRIAAKETCDSFFEVARYVVEPWTRQRLPFGRDGEELDSAAANALLMQVQANSASFLNEPNSLLESIAQRVDWRSGLPSDADRARALRTAAIAAVAAGINPEPAVRLKGAQFQAAVAAELGYRVWRLRRDPGFVAKPEIELPAIEMRDTLFGRKRTELYAAFCSTVRCTGGPPFEVFVSEGGIDLVATTDDVRPRSFTLLAGQPLKVSAKENVRDLKVREIFGEYRVVVTPNHIGSWKIHLTGTAQPILIPTYPSDAP